MTFAALAVALIPHLAYLPRWAVLLIVVTGLWRLLAERRSWRLPGLIIRGSATLLVTAGVLNAFHTLNGLDAGTALLASMAGLKALETRDGRDLSIMVYVGYFLCAAALLRDQSLALFAYTVLTGWLLTATLSQLQRRTVVAGKPANVNFGAVLKRSAWLWLLAVPLALVLFLFVPRLQGQLWALPTEDTNTISGLSDELALGDLASLTLSNESAMRVWFEGSVPPPDARYFRVLTLDEFDGSNWRRAPRSLDETNLQVRSSDQQQQYRISLEATQHAWLPALDAVTNWNHASASRNDQLELMQVTGAARKAQPVRQRLVYTLTSATHPIVPIVSTDANNLGLPANSAPRSRALAARLRADSTSDRDYVNHVLNYFNKERFSYTLESPRVIGDPTDDFLFNTRAGFCEHYSSAFAVLMRAAGLPARVVVGYHGGDYNRYGGYLLVRQANAHAWVEVGIESRWIRVDPTAAIAPERILQGAGDRATRGPIAALPPSIAQWFYNVRFVWDAARTMWFDNVVTFSTNNQQQLLNMLGLGADLWRGLVLSLTIGLTAITIVLGTWLTLDLKSHHQDPVTRAWTRICKHLTRRGVSRHPAEGPSNYLHRAARALPDDAHALNELRVAYTHARYLKHSDHTAEHNFLALAKKYYR
jgi:transglutaminase-like putative cysteine protease